MTERPYDNVPTEYGGLRDNRRTPNGRIAPRSNAQQAQDMRREAIRTVGQPHTGPDRDP